jgi:thiol-disulfide isomerase/thioredoxin
LYFIPSQKKKPTGDEAYNVFAFFMRPVQWQGRYPPDIEIRLLNGEVFKLSEKIGDHVIILNFFATWCGPCKEELPELNRFYEKHRDEPLILIGIDANEDEETVRKFIEEYNVKFPVGIDRGRKLQKLFTVRGYPTTLFIGADGKVKIYEFGPIMNADIAFDAFYKESMEVIRSEKGIRKEEYIKALKEQEESNPLEGEDREEEPLKGRRKATAEKMYCPCGCSEKVIDCECKTAEDIKKKLKKMNIDGRTDTEIIKELNREFCVRDTEG